MPIRLSKENIKKRRKAMRIFQELQQSIQEIWKSILRIFSPKDDNYPETGVQPFEGESFEENE
jgi:hypothetical protein